MADEPRVADEDAYAFDHGGLRRFIRAGDPLPDGWRWEDEPKAKPEPKSEPKSKPTTKVKPR